MIIYVNNPTTNTFSLIVIDCCCVLKLYFKCVSNRYLLPINIVNIVLLIVLIFTRMQIQIGMIV